LKKCLKDGRWDHKKTDRGGVGTVLPNQYQTGMAKGGPAKGVTQWLGKCLRQSPDAGYREKDPGRNSAV